jgi:hypothetical protein
MQSFKRVTAELLKLKLKLDDGATGKYVRAFITDKFGNPLTPAYADLSHIGFGIYSESALTMPALDQVVVSYAVFTDNTYTIKDAAYSEDADIFEKNDFDATTLFPPPARIELEFKKPTINIEIKQDC